MQVNDFSKKRRALIFRIVFLLMILQVFFTIKTLSETPSRDLEPLVIDQRSTLPLRDISAFGFDRDRGRIFAVSDATAEIASFRVTKQGLVHDVKLDSFRDAILDAFPFCSHHSDSYCKNQLHQVTTQWEAMQVIGDRSYALLQEHSNSIFIIENGTLTRVIGFHFDKFEGHERDKSRSQKREAHRGEGLVILPNGHILVAKEQFPAAIIELAPYGEIPAGFDAKDTSDNVAWRPDARGARRLEYNVVASWTRHDDATQKCDFSELTLGDDGFLYALSQTCRQIIKIERLSPDSATLAPITTWVFPKKIKNAEALLVLNDGSFLVGTDKKSKRDNIFLLRTK